MRRLVLLTIFAALATALAAAPSASAFAFRLAGGTPVSLKHGKGYARLKEHGSALGRIRHGRLRVTNLPGGKISVGGWEHVRRVGPRTKVYRGYGVTFSILGGRWRIRAAGRGINVSAVVRGRLVLAGTTGIYQLNLGRARHWPRHRRTFVLR